MVNLIKFRFFALGAILLLNSHFCTGQELITNPDFETTSSPWGLDNWAANEVSAVRDATNPHGGKWSMKVQMTKVINSPSVMYYFPKLNVRPSSTIQVKFWARGVSNGANLTIMVRREVDPWLTYLRIETNLTDEWQEYKYVVQLPSTVDPNLTSLRFSLAQVGVFWIDDVSVLELPAVDNSPVSAINTVRNPSFEAGTDGWTGTFRSIEFSVPLQESGSGVPAPENAKLETNTDNTVPDGQRFLTVKVDANARARITSGYFPARYGHIGQLNFWLRSDSTRTFLAGTGGGVNASNFVNIQSRSATNQWQKYSIPFTLKPAQDGVYFVSFHFDQPGSYDIDAVTYTENEQINPQLYPTSIAVQALATGPIGNLFAPKDVAFFKLVVAAEAPNTSKIYKLAVLNYLEQKIENDSVKVVFNNNGYGETQFLVPTTLFGAYRIEASQLNDSVVLAEQIYSVLPPLPLPETRPDSYFGGHVDLIPYNLEIAKKAGFRWLRLWPPLTTLWLAVEPYPGVWTFPLNAIANATKQGFKIVGVFGTVPDYKADINTSSSIVNRWSTAYPPKQISEWKEYVSRCFTAYSPYIKTWEVWNEPDGGFLQVRPELNKSEVYNNIFKATREVLDSIGKPVTLLGPAVANINASLGWDILKLGANKSMDAFSFHYYSLAAGGGNPDNASISPLLDSYRAYKNRSGDSMPLWHTEGGVYLQGGRSWLSTYRVPSPSPMKKQQAAASMVRGALLFKAMGVKHYFDYELGANAAGKEVNSNSTCSFIELTGIPGPAIAAHTAMVYLTEDAIPLGFDTLVGNVNKVKIARFRDTAKKRNVDVYWSTTATSLRSVASLKNIDKVLDMMGNPVDTLSAQTGEYPLYVLRGEPMVVNLNVVMNGDNARPYWRTTNEAFMKIFEVEKSFDGNGFSNIGSVDADNVLDTSNYSFTDNTVLDGKAFYRLKMIQLDSSFTYSPIVNITNEMADGISIYSNPVIKSAVFAHPSQAVNTVANILSIDGKRLRTIAIIPFSVQTVLDVNALPKGTYLLQYLVGKKEQVLKFIKQ